MNIRMSGPVTLSGHLLAALLCALLLALASPGAAAQQSPFVLLNGGVFDGPGNEIEPEVTIVQPTGPLLLEVGSLPNAHGRFRADYGSLGFEVQVTGGINREVDGGGAWTDGFLVTGGTGSGTLAVSSQLHGAVAGNVDLFFMLFVSPQPFELATLNDAIDALDGAWQLQLPNATRVMFTGVANRCGLPAASNNCGHVPFENYDGPLDLVMNVGVPFTYGQRFYTLTILGGGVGVFGGSIDFFDSANFGINVPPGTALSTLSGTSYAVAVPEPAVWLLMAIGALTLCLRRRGSRHRAR
jgi:hypothetical protein